VSKTAILVGVGLALLRPAAWAQSPGLDELLAQAAKWQSDTSRQPLFGISEIVRKAGPTEKRDLERKFIAFLRSGASLAGKEFICREIGVIGSAASVPVLADMLADPKTVEMGRFALERIPDPSAGRALRAALPKATGSARVGIVNSLGIRGDGAAVPVLRPLALGSPSPEAEAARFALARIADPAAVAVLGEAYSKSTGEVRASVAQAYLQAANRLADQGNRAAALAIYRALYAALDPPTVRAAALRGLASAGGPEVAPVLLENLRGDELRLQAVAAAGLLPNSAAQLAAEFPKLGEAAQIRVLGLLSERRDTSALPAFMAALRSSSKPVRLAALEGIGPIGNADSVPALAAIAGGTDAAEQQAARAALARLPGKDADRAVTRGIVDGTPPVKREMVRAAGERGSAEAAPVLLRAARDSDDEVRRESLKALAAVGGAGEIPGLVDLVVSPVQARDRTEAARSLGTVLRRSDSSRIQEVLRAYEPSRELEVRTALLRVMGHSGSAGALPLLRAGLRDQNAEVKRAAILALSEWPDITTVPDLMETARGAANPAHQVLALRGAVQLIGLPNPARPHRESAKLLADAMSVARQADEKRAILALLPRYPVQEALDLAKASVDDTETGAEAKAAVARLERTVRR
jgi:HEAT repeat protein